MHTSTSPKRAPGSSPEVPLSPARQAQKLSYRFRGTKAPEKSALLIQRCEAQGGVDFALAAGNMCLDMAFSEEKRGDVPSEAWLQRARHNWSEVMSGSNGYYFAAAGHAAMRLAVADTYEAHALQGVIPPLDDRANAYKDLVRVAKSQAEIVNRRKRGVSEVVGNLGELSLLLLLERFSLRNDLPSWMAVPSLPSEDIGSYFSGKGGVTLRDSWDISVFNQFDQNTSPELTYKVQAKAAKNHAGQYTDDIAVISIMSDLSLDPNPKISRRERVPITQIAEECYAELFSPEPSVADLSRQKLNMREDLLLSLLDQRAI